jgi:hypothetical protein
MVIFDILFDLFFAFPDSRELHNAYCLLLRSRGWIIRFIFWGGSFWWPSQTSLRFFRRSVRRSQRTWNYSMMQIFNPISNLSRASISNRICSPPSLSAPYRGRGSSPRKAIGLCCRRSPSLWCRRLRKRRLSYGVRGVPFVVGPRDGLERLLSGLRWCNGYCIPDLDFDVKIPDGRVPWAELHSEGGFMIGFKSVFGVSQQHAGFPNTFIFA